MEKIPTYKMVRELPTNANTQNKNEKKNLI